MIGERDQVRQLRVEPRQRLLRGRGEGPDPFTAADAEPSAEVESAADAEPTAEVETAADAEPSDPSTSAG
jgi:hypothetical protein